MKFSSLFVNFILVLTVLISLNSCGLMKPNVQYVIRDSIVTKMETIYKDTIITVPGDTIRFQIPCDRDTVFITKSKSSSSLVQVRKGVITVQNNCDEKDILITKLRDQVEKFKSESKDSIVVKTVKEKYIPRSHKFYSWGFWVALGIASLMTMINTNLWTIIVGGVVSIVRILSKKKNKEKKED
jgi:hypothetical protein